MRPFTTTQPALMPTDSLVTSSEQRAEADIPTPKPPTPKQSGSNLAPPSAFGTQIGLGPDGEIFRCRGHVPGGNPAEARLGRTTLRTRRGLPRVGRHEQAEAPFREAVRLKPDWAAVHRELARLMIDLKRYPDAEEAAREAIRLDPTNATARKNLAKALRALKR